MNIVVLGSTGSIGRNTLEVAAASEGRLTVVGLAGHSNWRLLAEQARQFRPLYAAVTSSAAAAEVDRSCFPAETRLLFGSDALTTLAQAPEAQQIVSAVVGEAGLESTVRALEAGKQVALANKESLVVGGELVMRLAREKNLPLLPIDSEHGAIFQSILAGKKEEIARIILTASGGPFREYSDAQLENVTLDQALAHPTWSMGRKITIDSATLMNKALEMIEARWLFDLKPEQIQVAIHPQSYVHSMVEYIDGSVIAQISPPDMRLPIQYALTYPHRKIGICRKMDWTQAHKWEFFPPDLSKPRFQALRLAYDVIKWGGSLACAMNAANEIAVQGFIEGRLPFGKIVPICCQAVEKHKENGFIQNPTLEQLFQVDRRMRLWAQEQLTTIESEQCAVSSEQ